MEDRISSEIAHARKGTARERRAEAVREVEIACHCALQAGEAGGSGLSGQSGLWLGREVGF